MSCPCQHTAEAKQIRRRWALASAGWGIPLLVLALVPKCPFCLAGYVALVTGIGLSLTAANLIHTALFAVPVAVLILMTARTLIRRRSRLLLKLRQEQSP